ncbi:MAG TPA: hypothetical protein PLI09_23080 [Candidatus Hydrogenedentes bacterium]|nr:hypothetical protein [Candidatus Hydrogenedentota bacterium]
MTDTSPLRGLHWTSILLVALSLSIGWGIRGNFGHEYGAMIPGALAATAACLLSGRPDWRERVHFFAMFGALGWAFGGSISYMQVIAFSHSGHLPSQIYGFFCLFVIGFLWGGMGGAGTAFPAVADRDRLTELFRPLSWIFVVWFISSLFVVPWIENWETREAATWSRHESVLYWFDADWIPAITAILALFLFDLWERRAPNILWLPCFAAGGALAGFFVQALLAATHLTGLVTHLFVHRQGDLHKLAKLAAQQNIPMDQALEGLLINWPQGLLLIPHHVGWIFGLIGGISLYFALFGKFRSGASLFLHMAVGWFVCFLIFPVFLNFGGAGFRMTPPRGDDWAGIVGVFLGTALWLYRNNYPPVLFASLVSGIVGGLGFSGAAWIKLMMVAPGNPARVSEPATVAAWTYWQGQNWHSFLEQSYGFINGIGIALAMGLLATRVKTVQGDPKQRRWTEVYAVSFVLFLLTFLNIFKNVPEWTKSVVPATMRAPLFESINLSAELWFVLVWGLMAAMGTYMLARHLHRPIPLIPKSWLGKGQLLYLVFLWMIVTANFERALPSFSEQRILTEGVIFVNAIMATFMILACAWETNSIPLLETSAFHKPIRHALWAGVAAVLIASFGMTATVRMVYGDTPAGHSSIHKRFGPDATWRIAPLEKGKKHS